MAILASTIMTETRALLNDPTGAIYVDAPMWPLMNKAYRELQTKLNALGISTAKEVSAVIDVPVNTLRMGDATAPPLPTDLLYPISLEERQDGSTSNDDWRDMDEVDVEPSIAQGNMLIYWAWREDELKFIGATTIREIRIKYMKGIGVITGGSSVVGVLNCEQWLAQRTAAIAALVLGSNATRSAALDSDLTKPGGVWDDFQATLVKRRQGIPVRRRRTRYRIL